VEEHSPVVGVGGVGAIGRVGGEGVFADTITEAPENNRIIGSCVGAGATWEDCVKREPFKDRFVGAETDACPFFGVRVGSSVH